MGWSAWISGMRWDRSALACLAAPLSRFSLKDPMISEAQGLHPPATSEGDRGETAPYPLKIQGVPLVQQRVQWRSLECHPSPLGAELAAKRPGGVQQQSLVSHHRLQGPNWQLRSHLHLKSQFNAFLRRFYKKALLFQVPAVFLSHFGLALSFSGVNLYLSWQSQEEV